MTGTGQPRRIAEDVPASVLNRLPTPCLLVDLAAVDRNIAAAVSMCENSGVRLRPHFKAHKCTTLLRRQTAAGSCSGVTCQTASEALVLASAGFSDILVANEVVDPAAVNTLAQAAAQSSVSVAVDCLDHVRILERAAERRGVTFGVLIELDLGIGRCGLPANSEELLVLAHAIGKAEALHFRGIQAYEGHVVFREDRKVRETLLWQAYSQILHERQRLEDSGFECELVSGGGTGTIDLAVMANVVSEIQAGSYVLMDARYAAMGLGFEPAIYVAARVISRRSVDSGVLDVGLKETSVEYGLPRPTDGAVRVLGLSDEHARFTVPAGDWPRIGEVLLLVPAHVDPTVNLHDALFVWEGTDDLAVWPIDGRRSVLSDAAEV